MFHRRFRTRALGSARASLAVLAAAQLICSPSIRAQELTGGPSDVCLDNKVCTLADATSSENGLAKEYETYLLTGGTGLPGKTPDSRITGVHSSVPYSTLGPGPFQLTNELSSDLFPYDSYAASPVHRFYQMWQQFDCNAAHASATNPSGFGNNGSSTGVYGGGSYTNCSDASQPGVQPILTYLASLKPAIKANCEAGHYYLLNNYNPGYFGDGSSAFTGTNSSNTPFTIPPVHSSMRANLVDTTKLYADIQSGNLPAVSYVRPSGWVDGHPASSKCNLFEGFVKRIVEMVQSNSALWSSTAIFITTDEGGGYCDSGYVQPLDFFGDGTRIPLIAVSPYTLPGHISHDYTDHVSLLKFIERNWNLPTITQRSRDNFPNPKYAAVSGKYVPVNSPALGDLFDLFDFGQSHEEQ